MSRSAREWLGRLDGQAWLDGGVKILWKNSLSSFSD